MQLATEDYLEQDHRSPNHVHSDYGALRWLEFSGLLVVLAMLADVQPASMTLSDMLDVSALCNATLYSALSICLALGLVTVTTVKERFRVARRYALTEKGARIGNSILSVDRTILELSLPPMPNRGAKAATFWHSV